MRTVLLITYDISPYRGSEASVSWNYVNNMQHSNKLIVLYGRGKEEIENYLQTHDMPNVSFWNIKYTETQGDGLFADIKYNWKYRKWHYNVYLEVRQIIQQQEHIDIIHYLNPIGFKEPGFVYNIKNIPYIWGPMKAVENKPFPLFSALSIRGKINALTRRIVHNALFLFSLRVRKAIKRADVIFATTPNTVKMLKQWYNKESYYLPENGIVKMECLAPINFCQQELRLIWIGAINERKALMILLDALLGLETSSWHLDICGTGPLEHKLKLYSKKISSNITWHGQMPRSKVQELLKDAHLHVVSSLGEGNPTTIWEAMSFAVPTMSLDHCGMSGVICDKCGIKIPIKSYNQVVSDMAANIDRIIDNPSIITELSKGVIECSKKFMWVNRIQLFNDTYDRLIQKYLDMRNNENSNS